MIFYKTIKDQILSYVNSKQNGTLLLLGQSKKLKLDLIEDISKSISSEKILLLDENNVPMEKIKYMLNFVKLKSPTIKFIVIDLDNVTIYSMNAMLKTLEEPPLNCFFFLLKSDTNVIPTIFSRAVRFYVNPDKTELIKYILNKYNYSLNLAEFVCSLNNNDFDLVEHFSFNFWDIKNKKIKENYYRLINFLIEPRLDLVFEEDFWLKNFDSFHNFRILCNTIKAFIRDWFIFHNKIYDREIIKIIEKNLIYTKVFDKEKLFNCFLKMKVCKDDLISLFFKVNKINNSLLFRKINKRILFISFMYGIYSYLRGNR